MPQAPALTQEALAERTAAVASTALARLLELGRRGRISALWRALLDEADARLTRYEDAVSRGGAHHSVPCTIAFLWGRGEDNVEKGQRSLMCTKPLGKAGGCLACFERADIALLRVLCWTHSCWLWQGTGGGGGV